MGVRRPALLTCGNRMRATLWTRHFKNSFVDAKGGAGVMVIVMAKATHNFATHPPGNARALNSNLSPQHHIAASMCSKRGITPTHQFSNVCATQLPYQIK